MSERLRFWVNGELHVVHEPDPRTLLIDYLRSDEVGLTGTKKSCGQGGCGACTVTLARCAGDAVEHLAVNSCLRPLCSIDGMAVTTVEGLGGLASTISPTQHRIAVDNGSQCGYCTPGWVMSMHSFLAANGDADVTQEQIEGLFDGNLCRCTGYRSILYAMRHFATDWGPLDEQGCMTCTVIPGEEPAVAPSEPVSVPSGLAPITTGLRVDKDGYSWLRVASLVELLDVLREHGSVDDVKLVAGNTSIGVYGEPAQGVTLGPPHLRIDISQIPALHGATVADGSLVVGAATTYTELLDVLDGCRDGLPVEQRSGLDAVRYMAQRTAGRIVRDVASLAGNTMLVVRHVDGTDLPPFPSDLFTALCAMGASVDVVTPSAPAARRLAMLDFAAQWRADEDLQRGCVIVRYHVPFTTEREWARSFKVALREVNAHSIVNACLRVRFGTDATVADASAVFGGIGPIAFHATGLEQLLIGRRWDADTLAAALAALGEDVAAQISATATRLADVPDEGFTDEYRTALAESFLYQFFVCVAEQVAPDLVGPAIASAAGREPRPVSTGTQSIQTYPDEYPVSFPFVKVDGFLQATGEARYTTDAPTPGAGVEAAFVTSTQALATFSFAIVDDLGNRHTATPAELADDLRQRFAGFVDLVTAADVPGANNQASGGYPDDPLICDATTTACGQVLAIVLARRPQQALDIAWWVQQHHVDYSPIAGPDGAPLEPVLSLDAAIDAQHFLTSAPFDIASVTRVGSDLSWVDDDRATLGGVDCIVVGGRHTSQAAQMHFYMEPHAAVASPGEGRQMTVLSSTQNPDTVHGATSAALALDDNQVEVQIRRVGGGYGGKAMRTPWSATNAAIAAAKLGRPVKLTMQRDVDSTLFGHENPLRGDYRIAVGTGVDANGSPDPHSLGRMMGMHAELYIDAGNTADCTPIVLDCVQLRFDNAYMIPNFQTSGKICLTNTTSNTSFRSLDAISGITILEDGIEAAAHELGLLPEDVRTRNLYRLGDATPYGEILDSYYLPDVWAYATAHADFEARLAAVQAFNRANRWVKRGISMIPIQYGMGFNSAFLERGDALVDIYDGDGTVIVRHGGAEIGQGLNTQVTQLVARALNIPMRLVRIGVTSTAIIPNPEATGASTGTAFNGGAAMKAADELRSRLENFCVGLLKEHGRQWCTDQHIDFWNHDEGWQAIVGSGADRGLMWTAIVKLASAARLNLSAQAQHNETGGTALDTGLLNDQGTDPGAQHFVGYTFSVACSEVEVDILTGEVEILRSDLVYDMGKSINPATDVGQIEGAFMQGVGRVLLENVVVQPTGPNRGQNNTTNTWGYKIPATTSVPRQLNVDLYPRESSSEVPENPNLLMSAKEVGEPPLCMAATVYFALKHAILDSRTERGKPGWFRMDMPCTVQRVREACALGTDELTLDPVVGDGLTWRRL